MSLIPDFKIGIWNAWIFTVYIVFFTSFLLCLVKQKNIPSPSDVGLSKAMMSLCAFSKLVMLPAVIYSIFYR